MPLDLCPDCNAEISTKATACPKCGCPNKPIVKSQQNNKQRIGCVFLVLGLLICVIFPLAGAVVAIAGLITALMNTRLW